MAQLSSSYPQRAAPAQPAGNGLGDDDLVPEEGVAARWLALDDPGEWPAFGKASTDQPGYWESGIAIDGMYCAACGFKLEEVLASVPGVAAATVAVASGRARVMWDSRRTKPSAWLQAVYAAGYKPWPTSQAEADLWKQEQRKLLWRLVVAGLCMMQVMMYSLPTYVTEPGQSGSDAVLLMRWASWVLALPVMFFACGPFFQSAAKDLSKGRIHMDLPVALGLIITFAVSSAATFSPHGWWGKEVWFDSLTMFVFFLLAGRWMEAGLRARTAGALDALMRRLPTVVQRKMADGSWEAVAVRRLQLGDVVRVRPGEAFPGDGCLCTGPTQVDEALLNGESRPVLRAAGESVLAGSYNLGAEVELRIDGLGADTRYAAIVGLMESAALDKPRLSRLADSFAKPFLACVLLASLGAALWWWQTDPARAVMAAVAVLVVTCPCALSLATPAAMLAAAGALAKRGMLLRQINALEVVCQVDTVVFDKTGTLTSDAIELLEVRPRAGWSVQQASALAAAMARGSLHPVSRALLHNGAEPVTGLSNLQELAGQGLEAQWNGTRLRLGNARFCGADRVWDGHTSVYLADDQGVIARFLLRELLRPEAAEAVAALQNMGMQVEMLSGDRSEAVALVAQRLGLTQARGDCSVELKLDHVRALQAQGRRVLMVGDGLNDSPVLACANVSVAVDGAVPVAQRQADCVMAGSDLRSIALFIQHGRQTMRIVRQNLAWAALYNAACIPLAVAGMLPAWAAGLGMASSSLLVVLNAARLATLAPLADGDAAKPMSTAALSHAASLVQGS